MSTRFVVLTNDPTGPQKDLLTGLLRELKVGWWHWYQDVWLVVDPEGRGVRWWRDRIKEEIPRMHMLLVQVPKGGTWSAVGEKRHFEWLHETWKKVD